MNDELDLLLDGPGRARTDGPGTSRRAALNLRKGALKHRILLALRSAGEHGATDYELWRHCDPNGRPHSAATRRGELEDLGAVARTSRTRPTDTPGNEGIVHVLTGVGHALLAELEQ